MLAPPCKFNLHGNCRNGSLCVFSHNRDTSIPNRGHNSNQALVSYHAQVPYQVPKRILPVSEPYQLPPQDAMIGGAGPAAQWNRGTPLDARDLNRGIYIGSNGTPFVTKQPCKFHQKGICRNGTLCRFSHDNVLGCELSSKSCEGRAYPDGRSTSKNVCKYNDYGTCRYGDLCRFQHTDGVLSTATKSQIDCYKAKFGECKNRSKCPYRHPTEEFGFEESPKLRAGNLEEDAKPKEEANREEDAEPKEEAKPKEEATAEGEESPKGDLQKDSNLKAKRGIVSSCVSKTNAKAGVAVERGASRYEKKTVEKAEIDLCDDRKTKQSGKKFTSTMYKNTSNTPGYINPFTEILRRRKAQEADDFWPGGGESIVIYEK